MDFLVQSDGCLDGVTKALGSVANARILYIFQNMEMCVKVESKV